MSSRKSSHKSSNSLDSLSSNAIIGSSSSKISIATYIYI